MESRLPCCCSITKFVRKYRTLSLSQIQQHWQSITSIDPNAPNLYQARLKEYQDAKQHAAPHNFKFGDIVHCANMKPNKLDSKFSLAKHVIIETKARDTFSLVNVNTGTTLVRNAKYLKHAPSEYVTDLVEQEVGTKTKESNDSTELRFQGRKQLVHAECEICLSRV